ncbi:MAG: ribonuclease E/G [Candidatus Shikimatogenerans bostrichidophilus]|nr:MAG: ribonuclease E/G [Candidatus Shikimatogenerans bostrichidophilus]
MIKKLIINCKKRKILIALLENNKLVELYEKEINNKKDILVGDIFLGKVIFVSKGMNAAFIDIGYIKYGFLHLNDLINNNINIIKNNKIIFKKKKKIGQKILVQIIKEPINNKGPKLTCKINLIGRYIIFLPFYKKILISKKIKNIKIIKKIKKKINKIIKNKFGIIIRTICINNNIKFKNIKNEINNLKKKWYLIKKNIYNKKNKIYSEKDLLFSYLRDNFDNYYKYIICNNYKLFIKIISYIYYINKKKIKIIKYYNNNINIFDKYGINKQKKIFLDKYVSLYNGSYLIIENTETLHIFDINSNMKKSNNNYNSAYNINIIAIKEIARQIRLRNMGGIIIIDCIDMNKKDHKKKIYKYFKKKMINDKCKHKILPLSKFNIIQITRHRLRQELIINNINLIYESHYLNIKKIENFLNLYYLFKKKKIYLYIDNFISYYFKKKIFLYRLKWFLKYKNIINIITKK